MNVNKIALFFIYLFVNTSIFVCRGQRQNFHLSQATFNCLYSNAVNEILSNINNIAPDGNIYTNNSNKKIYFIEIDKENLRNIKNDLFLIENIAIDSALVLKKNEKLLKNLSIKTDKPWSTVSKNHTSNNDILIHNLQFTPIYKIEDSLYFNISFDIKDYYPENVSFLDKHIISFEVIKLKNSQFCFRRIVNDMTKDVPCFKLLDQNGSIISYGNKNNNYLLDKKVNCLPCLKNSKL
jgi:hypothetical protein